LIAAFSLRSSPWKFTSVSSVLSSTKRYLPTTSILLPDLGNSNRALRPPSLRYSTMMLISEPPSFSWVCHLPTISSCGLAAAAAAGKSRKRANASRDKRAIGMTASKAGNRCPYLGWDDKFRGESVQDGGFTAYGRPFPKTKLTAESYKLRAIWKNFIRHRVKSGSTCATEH